jgi:hypothetical protein
MAGKEDGEERAAMTYVRLLVAAAERGRYFGTS